MENRPLADGIEEMIKTESAAHVLEIGRADICYGALIADCQYKYKIPNSRVDRILLTPMEENISYRVYDNIFTPKNAEDLSALPQYDFILVTEMAEKAFGLTPKELILKLLEKAAKQVMIIIPEYTQEYKRPYHPLVFTGFDFTYSVHFFAGRSWQVYQFYKPLNFAALPVDIVPVNEEIIKPMDISVIMPHMNVTGGLKALMAVIRSLKEKGHIVKVYYRGDTGTALPDWGAMSMYDFTEQHVIPKGEKWLDHVKDTDIILITFINQMADFIGASVPVVMWEQGYELLFGDSRTIMSSMDQRRIRMQINYHLPINIMSVSPIVQHIFKGRYNRITPCCPCGIDPGFYRPGPKHTGKEPVILLVGRPSLRFKGFKFAFDALKTLWDSGVRFKVRWAAQTIVNHGPIPFPLEVIVSPTQEELAVLYSSSDIYFSTSLYESYSLPPLEAMASGTAVAAIDNGGINSYARHDENCLLCPQGDLHAAVKALKFLIENPDERKRLEKAGRKTAVLKSSKNTIGHIEQYLSDIITRKQKR